MVVEDIKNKIYKIRWKYAMLNSYLGRLYCCFNGTKDINKAVKRNIKRFPDDFYFQLMIEESSRFQIGTLELEQGYYSKFLSNRNVKSIITKLILVFKL